MIGDAMVSRLEGDLWFKRHFAVLVVSTLFSVMGNGYANQRVFQHFEDVDKIKDLNWCKFLLDCLVEAHAKWIQKKDRAFTGPLVFLTVFYVDRVAHLAREIPRTVPSVCGWTTKLLNEREFSEIRAGGFGRGMVEVRLGHDSGVHQAGGVPANEDTDKPFEEQFVEKTVTLATTLEDDVHFLE